VTDGASNRDNAAVDNAKDLVGECPLADYIGDTGECAVEVADFLYNQENPIITHTIGFNLPDSDWLREIAISDADIGLTAPTDPNETPQSRYYEAESSAELVSAVESILETIDRTDSTFVAPGATIDQFSRLAHRSELYLSLFKPSQSPGWQGNLKRYSLTGAALTDANGADAVDADGAFVAGSRSYWSESPDGADIAIGPLLLIF